METATFQYWAQDVLADGGLLVEEGHPWLNVGDRVLMGVVEQGGPDILYTNVSPWTVYEIVDGLVVFPERRGPSGDASLSYPQVARDLVGLSEDQASVLLRSADASP